MIYMYECVINFQSFSKTANVHIIILYYYITCTYIYSGGSKSRFTSVVDHSTCNICHARMAYGCIIRRVWVVVLPTSVTGGGSWLV